ncbi:hypothetical protein QWZ08_05085 [Ferruginibacter paludis]|uniref:hypothetical protein n=1 Tax=Ferruginibacter paludis TaxID=1310417 RepID=UPI0025B36C61|nr:hypothetical protein [Ferruginibacter paludis]MDN3654987.1 hypothetical protein [Ferruginibacter paludis]
MYLKKILIVCCITWLAASLTGMLLDNMYKKRWLQLYFAKTDELIKGNTNYDIIFLGNSRVHFGINPYYIDSVTKLNSYNFGTGGADAEDIMVTSDVYLQKHAAPKLAVISLDAGMLFENTILKTRFHYLFYLQNDTVNKHMQRAGFPTDMIKIFPFTKYSFFDEYNRTSLFVRGKPYPVFDHNIYRGFLNIHQFTKTTVDGLYNTEKKAMKVWDPALIYLQQTVMELQKKGCDILFVYPPERIPSPNRKEPITAKAASIFSNIAIKNHLQIIHFESDLNFTDDYFVDDIHLNEPGTRIYSRQLADSIARLYPNLRQSPL